MSFFSLITSPSPPHVQDITRVACSHRKKRSFRRRRRRRIMIDPTFLLLQHNFCTQVSLPPHHEHARMHARAPHAANAYDTSAPPPITARFRSTAGLSCKFFDASKSLCRPPQSPSRLVPGAGRPETGRKCATWRAIFLLGESPSRVDGVNSLC